MERIVYQNEDFKISDVDNKGFVVTDLLNGEEIGDSELLNENELNEYLKSNGFEVDKDEYLELPDCKLTGQDGNVFNLMAIVFRALKGANQKRNGELMIEAVQSCKSYDEALQTFMHYVNVQ